MWQSLGSFTACWPVEMILEMLWHEMDGDDDDENLAEMWIMDEEITDLSDDEQDWHFNEASDLIIPKWLIILFVLLSRLLFDQNTNVFVANNSIQISE